MAEPKSAALPLGGAPTQVVIGPGTGMVQRGYEDQGSEIAVPLLAFHRGGLVEIDQARTAFRGPGSHGLGNNIGDRAGGRFDRPAQRVAAERAKPDRAKLRLLAGVETHPVVVD